MCVHSVLGAKRIARQYWRAWIETAFGEFASQFGCGIARQYWRAWIETLWDRMKMLSRLHRPPVLAGVD